MSETKKRAYKRETCTEAIKEVIQHAIEINKNRADYEYYNKVKELILFGSYVNTDNDRIHDVDFCFISDDIRPLGLQFVEDNPETSYIFHDIVSQFFAEYLLQIRYLKGGRRMLSIHSNVQVGDKIKLVAMSDEHIVLIKDHELTDAGRRFLEE